MLSVHSPAAEQRKQKVSVFRGEKRGDRVQIFRQPAVDRGRGHHSPMLQSDATGIALGRERHSGYFKVYIVDSGLLIAMLEDGTQFDVLQGNLFGYKGAIFENLAADILAKMGRKLYYFHKDSGLEIDFVMRYAGQSTLLEVKATTGNTKSAKTIPNHPEKYHVGGAIKLGNYNVGRAGNILTLPFYMAFLLTAF